MTGPVSNPVGIGPAINWVVSRLPYLAAGSRRGRERASGLPESAHSRATVSPGVAQGPAGQSAVGSPADAGLGRGWIEDQMLAELEGRLLSRPPASQAEHLSGLRSAITQLEADPVQADAVRVLSHALTGYRVVLQGRNALLGV